MRAELKIGIAVGVVIAAAAVLYVVFHDTGAKQFTGPQAGKAPPAAAPARGAQATGGSETLVPAFAGAPAQPGGTEQSPSVSELAPGAEAAAPVQPTTQPVIVPQPTMAEGPMPSRLGSASPPAGSEAGTPAVASKTNTTYVVKKGDKGFWDIAEKVYGPGKGKYWTLIEKANKQVDYAGLKEGMTLTIPPLPDQPAGPVTAVAPSVPAGAGEKIYVVQPNDGWWSIARKEYGDGKYWEELRKANPQIQGNLKVGQKIKIPPLGQTGSASPATAPSTPAKPTRATPPPNSDRPIFD